MFTYDDVNYLTRYLKGYLTNREKDTYISPILKKDKSSDYNGTMFRGLAINSEHLSTTDIHEDSVASWTTNVDVAVDFAMKTHGRHKVLLVKRGKGKDVERLLGSLKALQEPYGLESISGRHENEILSSCYNGEYYMTEIVTED